MKQILKLQSCRNWATGSTFGDLNMNHSTVTVQKAQQTSQVQEIVEKSQSQDKNTIPIKTDCTD